MRSFWALPAFLRLAIAAQHPFHVHNDILAFPQYEIIFSETFITSSAAESLLKTSQTDPDASQAPTDNDPANTQQTQHDLQRHREQCPSGKDDIPTHTETEGPTSAGGDGSYERMYFSSTPYLCSIPAVVPPAADASVTPEATPEEKRQELMRASDRGWELLREMQGHCLYFSAGWWVYSFCYNQDIKQFHPLPPGRPGVPIFPPMENKEIPSYVLGRFDSDGVESGKKGDKDKGGDADEAAGQTGAAKEDADSSKEGTKQKAEIADGADSETGSDVSLPSKKKKKQDQQQDHFEASQDKQLQVGHNAQSYLVRHLTGGTLCDVTNRPRRITVQFHCDPTMSSHISMIKETASCVYLMVVHTPLLCNDVAFHPPQVDRPESVVCREVVADGAKAEAEWKARKAREAESLLRGGSEGIDAEAAALLAAALEDMGQGQGQGQEHAANQQQQQQQQQQPPLIIGGVEVGAQKLVGGEASRTIKASNIIAKTAAQGAGGDAEEEGKILAVLARSDGKNVLTMTGRQLKERELDKYISKDEIEDNVRKVEGVVGDKEIPWEIRLVRTEKGLKLNYVFRTEDDAERDGVATRAKKTRDGDGAGKGAGEGTANDEGGRGGADETKAEEVDGTGSQEEFI